MSTWKPRKASLVDELPQKIIVGVAGGSAAGKTTMCENINRQMAFDRNFKVEIISLDSFYKNVDKANVTISEYNFDHPNALDFDLAYKTLLNLIESNERVQIPQYSFIEHARLKEPAYVGPANVIFFEGLMALYDKRIRDLMTYKIFINCDDDIRLCRRLKRDTTERGRTVKNVLQQYNKFVKNAFRDFILPSIVYADIIIPGSRNNRVSVDFIVQNIKNMAQRLNFSDKVTKTKIYFFGKSEIYDLGYKEGCQYRVTLANQSFLVFPTSDEYRRELSFFMNSLLSEIFSVEYFIEVFTCQFTKVLKALLKQLINLKSYNRQEIEILSVYQLAQAMRLGPNKHSIKVLLLPVAEQQFSRQIFTDLQEYIQKYPKCNFVILNAFCEINVPKLVYKYTITNVIMINLFVIANDKRFRQIMSNNIQAYPDNFDWFLHNHDIADKSVEIIAKDLQLFTRSQSDIFKGIYELQVSKQKEPFAKRVVDQSKQIQGIFHQQNVSQQQHENLCGFHALSSAMCLQDGKDILSKEQFLNNYEQLMSILNRNDYSPLQRCDLGTIMTDRLFAEHGNIGQLIYSCHYIQNEEKELEELSNMFVGLHSGKIKHFYILLGVLDHYTLLKVTLDQIVFYDSINTSLSDIVNGTNLQPPVTKDAQESKNMIVRASNMRQALQIVNDLLIKKSNIYTILIEKRIEAIVGTFNALKSQEEINKWLKEEYPKPVIEHDLFALIRKHNCKVSTLHKEMFERWLQHDTIKGIFNEEERNFVL